MQGTHGTKTRSLAMNTLSKLAEAFPALLLAAALMMPALAVLG